MPPLVRQPAQQRQPTGIRLIDDLIGADAEQAPPTERQATSIKPATNYETYVQPAILALRKLVRPVVKSMQEDPLGGYSPAALAGPLATMINMPRGTMLRHGGEKLLQTVEPKKMGPGAFGPALYAAPDVAGDVSPIAKQFAGFHEGGGAITPFRVNREMPVWDLGNVDESDFQRITELIGPEAAARARANPANVPAIVSEAMQADPTIARRAGAMGVQYPYG